VPGLDLVDLGGPRAVDGLAPHQVLQRLAELRLDDHTPAERRSPAGRYEDRWRRRQRLGLAQYRAAAEAREALSRFIEHHLGRRLASRRFLDEVGPMLGG
jgi:hypothetical protein